MRKQTFYLALLINLFINSQLFSGNLIGYWHNWNYAASPYIQLNQIDPRYNIIEIAFAVPVSTTDMTMTFTPDAVSQAVLISQIESLQSLGKKVLISIGGATATIDLANITQRNNFVSSMTSIINTYGFDGIDIDIESGNSILINGGTIQNPANPSMQNLIEAIRQIMQNYRAANAGKMMLTMAPETAYVQGGQSGFGSIWGGYLPIIHALRDSIDILQVQLYNSGTMYGIDGGIYSQGTTDFIIAMTEAVIQGFNTNGGFFIGLPANKVAVGLPACSLAAGGGFVDSLSLRAAVNYLLGNAPQPGNYSLANPNGYPSLGGMMTWSINWDALASCGGAYSYANSFEVLFEDELSPPNLLSPANSAVNVSINPNLSWTAVNEAANYRIQISASSDFNNNIINQLITQNNIAGTNLNYNTQYFWRVRAENGTNFGNWSNTFTFTTQSGTFSLFGGIIYANSSQTPMNNCSVSVRDQQNNLIAALISDNNGDFIVSGLSNGVYNIEISTTKIPGGITISDILNIRQNIAGLVSFNELQNKAADVNLSSSVSIADILPIRQKIAGINPIPNWAAPNFVFSPLTFQISNQNVLLIIQALSAGDVNGSHTP